MSTQHQSSRWAYLIDKYGYIGLFKHILFHKIPVATRNLYRRVFRNQHYVFRYIGCEGEIPQVEGMTVELFEQLNDIPQSVVDELLARHEEDGRPYRDLLEREFQRKACLWIIFVDGSVAGQLGSLRQNLS